MRFGKWKVAAVAMASSIAAACGGGDGGPVEQSGPSGTEPPVRGLMGGPEGEFVRSGYEDGSNQQQQSPDPTQNGSLLDCYDSSSCDEICSCLGVSGAVCDQYCSFDFDDGDFDEDDFGGDGDGDGDDFGGDGDGDSGDGDSAVNEDFGDACASLDDPCTRCACENIDDVTLCIDVCGDFF